MLKLLIQKYNIDYRKVNKEQRQRKCNSVNFKMIDYSPTRVPSKVTNLRTMFRCSAGSGPGASQLSSSQSAAPGNLIIYRNVAQ